LPQGSPPDDVNSDVVCDVNLPSCGAHQKAVPIGYAKTGNNAVKV
jgi:hypothetical protein